MVAGAVGLENTLAPHRSFITQAWWLLCRVLDAEVSAALTMSSLTSFGKRFVSRVTRIWRPSRGLVPGSARLRARSLPANLCVGH